MAKAAEKTSKAPESNASTASSGPEKSETTPQRKIPGNLPYITASGTLKKALDRIIEASRPDRFNGDFLENVLKLTGGAARACIPILKRMGFLTSDGTPSELYAKFRTDSGRAGAALQGLRNAFPEIFKKSEYAHTVDETRLKDIIVEITGLKSADPVASAIRTTFNVVKSYVPSNFDPSSTREDAQTPDENSSDGIKVPISHRQNDDKIGLVYNINIVLPETSDLKVLNAIFRSIKENLMQ